MKYEHLWERLLAFLNEWSRAVEVELGRIEVALQDNHSSTRVVEIRITHEQWEKLVTVPWGDFQTAAQEVRKSVLGLRGNERFLVYRQYELVPSETPTLPVESEGADLRGLSDEDPEPRLRWSAFDPHEPEDRETPP